MIQLASVPLRAEIEGDQLWWAASVPDSAREVELTGWIGLLC